MSWPLATSGLPDLGGVYTGMGTTTGSTAGPVTLAGTIRGSSVRSTAGGAATGTVSAAGTPAAGRPAASGRGGPAAVPGRPGSAEGVSAGMGRVGSGVGVSVGMGRIASGTGARPAASGLGAAGRGPAAAASGAGGSGTTGRMTASGAGGLTAATGSRGGATAAASGDGARPAGQGTVRTEVEHACSSCCSQDAPAAQPPHPRLARYKPARALCPICTAHPRQPAETGHSQSQALPQQEPWSRWPAAGGGRWRRAPLSVAPFLGSDQGRQTEHEVSREGGRRHARPCKVWARAVEACSPWAPLGGALAAALAAASSRRACDRRMTQF